VPYANLLRRPHVVRLLTGSLLGRLPTAMAALAIALTIRQTGGGYTRVGAVTGGYAIAAAIGGPFLGRAVDRLGQPRVLLGSAFVSAGGFVVLVAAPGDYGLSILGAVVAGAGTPPLEPCMRALWQSLVKPDELDTAYSLDAGAQELVFIAGPLVVAGIAAIAPPQAALGVSAGLGLAGALVVATAGPSRAWTPPPLRAPHWLGALRSPGLIVLILALAGTGWTVGAFNVFAVAYAESHTIPGGAGSLLALSAGGALVGAVCHGKWNAQLWHAPAERKAVVLAIGMTASYALVALVPGPALMSLAALLTGVFFAPLLSVAFGMVAALAPAGTLTEAFAWVVTLIGSGIAAGSAVGGQLIAAATLRDCAAVGAAGAGIGAVILLLGRGPLRVESLPGPSA
jgi:MFS family permease